MTDKRRRPTAEDRDLANLLRKRFPIGEYTMVVRAGDEMAFMAPAQLKTEGSFTITLENRVISVIPVKG